MTTDVNKNKKHQKNGFFVGRGAMAGDSDADVIIAKCEAEWDDHKDDCSGFVKAVAGDLGAIVCLGGNDQANAIIDYLGAHWFKLKDGPAAAMSAAAGQFVIGGLKDDPNGHVVVVVKGPVNRGKYPTAYWGRLNSVGKKKTTINWSWDDDDRDNVSYYSCPSALKTS